MIKECWKPITGYEGWYEVSNLGQIRRSKPGKSTKVGLILKQQTYSDGYILISLLKQGSKKAHLVSRLVCTAFHGPCPPGKNCNHIDGNKANNSADNLEWVTQSQNCLHKYRVLGHTPDRKKMSAAAKKGADHPHAKRYVVTQPNGDEILVVGLKKFCRDNGLSVGCMFQLATGSGHSYQHKGYKCRYA